MLLAQDPWVFMLGRVLPGIVKCGISVSQAYLSDISSQHDRAKNLGAVCVLCFACIGSPFSDLFLHNPSGILGSMYGLAFVFGPAAGGMLMRRGNLWATVWVALAATVLNVLVLLCLPEPPSSGSSKSKATEVKGEQQANGAGGEKEGKETPGPPPEKPTPKQEQQSLWSLLKQRGEGAGATVGVLLARKLCTSFASGLFECTFAEYSSRHLGLDGHILGLLLSYLGVYVWFWVCWGLFGLHIGL
jgi:MFS family permease